MKQRSYEHSVARLCLSLTEFAGDSAQTEHAVLCAGFKLHPGASNVCQNRGSKDMSD